MSTEVNFLGALYIVGGYAIVGGLIGIWLTYKGDNKN
jgi:hypothetical protein